MTIRTDRDIKLKEENPQSKFALMVQSRNAELYFEHKPVKEQVKIVIYLAETGEEPVSPKALTALRSALQKLQPKK